MSEDGRPPAAPLAAPRTAVRKRTPARRRREPEQPLSALALGRLGGALFIGGGLVSLTIGLFADAPVASRSIYLVFCVTAILTGIAALIVPWDRWPRRAALALPLLALALMSVGHWLDGGDPAALSVYLMFVFVWVGITQPRGTCVFFALPAVLAYVPSAIAAAPDTLAVAASAALALPLGIFLGEAVAWLMERLRGSDAALRKERALLEVMSETSAASNEAWSVEEAIERCLGSVCAFTGWPVGHAFLVAGDGSGELRSGAWRVTDRDRFASLRRATETVHYRSDVGLPGRVVGSGQPLWVADVREETDFIRGRLAHDLGVRSALAFPVLAGNRVVAVLEFFSGRPEQPDAHVLEVMSHVGEQLGRVIERDRAERVIAESERRLRESDAMKGTLLHAVAHDLRTSIASIQAAVTVTTHDDASSFERHRHLIEGAGAEARKMERVFDDLLDLDRIERGILEPHRAPSDLPAVTRRIVAEHPAMWDRVVVSPDELVADVEEAKVERIVENLLMNAVNHTPPDTPVWVAFEPSEGSVLLRVQDAGPGVPDDMKEAIFEPYTRTTTGMHETHGHGIGLWLVTRFARLHGGRAWVEDRDGGGASFNVLLPTPDPVETPRVTASSTTEAR